MLDKTKTIIVNGVFIAAASILLFAATTQFRQWSQYRQGEKSLAAGDHINAIAGFESAIHMYTPLSPIVEWSAKRLWIMGRDFETRGERDKSLIAYRALRSSFYSTHGLVTPGMKWIALCDEKINMLEPPVQPAK
jgi:hypothetical protein